MGVATHYTCMEISTLLMNQNSSSHHANFRRPEERVKNNVDKDETPHLRYVVPAASFLPIAFMSYQLSIIRPTIACAFLPSGYIALFLFAQIVSWTCSQRPDFKV